MSVWLTIPSARPVEEAAGVIRAWHRMGYKVALWRDTETDFRTCSPDLVLCDQYPGYATAVNTLIAYVIRCDPRAQWFVVGGDDTEPDLTHHADAIAAECCAHFGGSYGVMQPTGDRFAGGAIDRIAGSAWIGREFASDVYGGVGPLWAEYEHMFVDEELQCVAQQRRVFWQRPDLVQLHRHFSRRDDSLTSEAWAASPPKHLEKWNTSEHWLYSKALFERRRAAGFPGVKV